MLLVLLTLVVGVALGSLGLNTSNVSSGSVNEFMRLRTSKPATGAACKGQVPLRSHARVNLVCELRLDNNQMTKTRSEMTMAANRICDVYTARFGT